MGSAASRTAQRGAGPARKFPSRAPGTAIPPRAQQQQQRPPPSAQPHMPPSSATPSSASGASPRPRGGSAQASYSKDEAIRADGADPDLDLNQSAAFSSRLRQMGVAQPNPTYSPSSTANSSVYQYQKQQSAAAASSPTFPAAAGSNTTLTVLDARRRIQERADDEFRGLGQGQGREFLDVGVIRDALVMRSKGNSDAAIEERLGIKKGVLGRLGPRGRVEAL